MAIVMKRTAGFLPLILPHCPECPNMIAEQQARLAAITFCERSRAWRHVTTVEMTDAEGTPVAPDTAAIYEIEFAEFNGDPLTPVQFSTIEENKSGSPQYITQVAPNAVTVSPFIPGTLRISVFLKPLTDSEYGTADPNDPLFDRYNVVPEFFIKNHGNTIAAGALAEILSIPNEPWTNHAEAARYRAEFELRLRNAFRWNMRGQQRAPIRTIYRDM